MGQFIYIIYIYIDIFCSLKPYVKLLFSFFKSHRCLKIYIKILNFKQIKYYTFNRNDLIQKSAHIILTKDLVSTFANSIENIPSTW